METSAPASAEGANSSASARPKRSRTGCMTCRNRRRKCDEGKPICQNCISKGFECRYAAAFQILGKHNFTPEVKAGVKYANIRFAGDVSEPALETAASTSPQHDGLAQEQSVVLPSRNASNDRGNVNRQSFSDQTASPNSYEFALHGLLALGGTSGVSQGAHAIPPSVTREEQGGVSMYDFATASNIDPPLHSRPPQERPGLHRTETGQSSAIGVDETSHGTSGPSPSFPNFENLTGTNEAHGTPLNTSIAAGKSPAQASSSNESLELLKLYRYNIAPWLDICDTDQHFGVALLTGSNRSLGLRQSVMTLARASSSNIWMSESQIIEESTMHETSLQGAASDPTEELIASVLGVLADMVPTLAASWLRADKMDNRMFLQERLLLVLPSSRLANCAYWLLIRLELSRALMAGNNRIALPFLSVGSGALETTDPVAQYAYDAIALCVDSVMFAQGDDDRWLQQRYGMNRVEMWKTLVQKFAHWYMHRPQALQPIIEMYPRDGVLTDDDYPTIVFTSGAALLANQLYHTGMLLLLQDRPRFAEKPSQNSPSMSTLWHAHRICGIAIQNDRPGWWDPCLVASLIVAGRIATHTSQHSAIVRTLESVQRLTGWIIEPYVEQLRTEWQLADD